MLGKKLFSVKKTLTNSYLSCILLLEGEVNGVFNNWTNNSINNFGCVCFTKNKES